MKDMGSLRSGADLKDMTSTIIQDGQLSRNDLWEMSGGLLMWIAS